MRFVQQGFKGRAGFSGVVEELDTAVTFHTACVYMSEAVWPEGNTRKPKVCLTLRTTLAARPVVPICTG